MGRWESTISAPVKGCLMFNDNGSFLLALFEFFLFFAWFMCLFWSSVTSSEARTWVEEQRHSG